MARPRRLVAVHRVATRDFNEATDYEDERDRLVLSIYRSVGAGWCFHVLVGRAVYPVTGFATHAEADVAGLASLRRVKGWTDVPLTRVEDAIALERRAEETAARAAAS